MSKSLEFYQLERPPFEDGVRDAAAVGTRPLRAALERARRFVEAETAVVCVKGRPGIGKTYFGLALPSVLSAGTLIARIGQPAQPWPVLHATIAKGFDLDPHGFSVDALQDLRDSERRLVIEIDPVEQLQLDAFTPLLSLLSHAYLPDRRLVQAVLIGDFTRLPEAAREGLAQLGSATLELEALPESDVPSYVQKRLDRAGYRGQPLFSRAACEEIRRRSEGVPREVNRICTAAVELAAERRASVIEPDLIRDTCAALPPVPAAARPPAQEALARPAAPAAGSPRAVLGRVKLETRSMPPARPAPLPATAAGQARRIEPLPPEPGMEPVVQAEPETPLMDAVFVDDDLPAQAVEPAPQRPAVTPPGVAVQPRPAPVEPEPPAPAAAAPTSPAARRAEPAAPAVEPVAPARPPGRAELPPPPRGRERAFPWLHVGVSLAASWLVAGGLFWVYAHPERPASAPARAEAPLPEAEPAASSFQATAALPEPAQTSPEPAPAPPPPEPESEPEPIETAAAAATPAAAPPPPAAAPRKPSPPPAPPPLRVELRARGREVLYPPRPASAYAMPAQ